MNQPQAVAHASVTRLKRFVYVDCPYCGARHRHEWGWQYPTPGVQRSHCKDQKRKFYYIPAPTNVEIEL